MCLFLTVVATSTSQEVAADDAGVQPEGAAVSDEPTSGERRELPSEDTLVFRDEDAAATDAAEPAEVGAFGVWDLVRMILVLLLVVGTIYGIVAFLRRRAPGSDSDSDSPIRVLATRSLGGSREIYAVMIGRSVYVLAGGDQAMQLVTRIDDRETVDELVLAHSHEQPRQRTFGSMLSQVLANLAVPGSAAVERAAEKASSGAAASLLKAQRDRVRQMR